jgi:glycosyltransferase involved in cell wall biosynthesis
MAKHLVDRGHNVLLLVTSNERRAGIIESDWDGVRTIETPDLLWGRLRSGWDLWDLFNRVMYLEWNKGHYDLIHCFETRPATIYPALFWSKRFQVPLFTDWQDWWGRGGIINVLRPRWYRFLFGWVETYYEEAFRKRGDGLTVISSALAQRAIGLGVPPERICHISGGTFPDFFKACSKEECRNRVGISWAGPILCFSSLDTHLDLEIMMESLALVAERYPKVKLMITGRASQSIMDMANDHAVEGNVHLTGFLPLEELPWYLGCADVFVMPFPDEIYNVGRWPNKIGEYMSLARPTVSNPFGDIKPLFERHEVGLLAGWDPADFAQKIIYLIENPKLSREMGHNARRVAVTEYDWKVLVGKLEAFYFKILELA